MNEAIWIMLTVGSLLMPVQHNNFESCQKAALVMSRRLSTAIACVSPDTGETYIFTDGKVDHESEQPQ